MNFKKWLAEAMAHKGSFRGSIFQRLVAAQYKLAPSADPSAQPAFDDLKNKLARQSEFLGSKYKFRPTQDDPYPSMKVMTQDIERQRASGIKKPEIPVYAEPPGEGQGHPAWDNPTNVTGRGVHDVIAHYFGQHPFSARGEYAAYNRHLKTLCNPEQVKAGKCLAAQAMFTEVVGQISYYYVYGDYTEQKMVILNDFDHSRVGALNPGSPLNNFFELRGKELLPRSDFQWDMFAQAMPQLAAELKEQEKSKSIAPLQPIEPQQGVRVVA